MSIFIKMLCDMLPMASNLQDTNNSVRKVLDYSVGEYMDNLPDIFDELFLTSATGGWLDAWGKDFGVLRKVDESDDDYRQRILFEKLEYLTAKNLSEIYGVELYSAFDGFNPVENDLTSDNPYLTDWFVGVAPEEIQKILNNKFVLDGSILWYNGSPLDYLTGYPSNKSILKYNLELYNLTDLSNYQFKGEYKVVVLKMHLPIAVNIDGFLLSQNRLTEVELDCPNVTSANHLFENCVNLPSIDLSLPKAYNIENMFNSCTSLTSVDLDLPKGFYGSGMFNGCTSLESISLSLPLLNDAWKMFKGCTSLTDIDLDLPTVYNCSEMFKGCTSLTDIDLELPVCYVINEMFNGCTSLTNLKLDFGEFIDITDETHFDYMLEDCSNLETINVNIPSNLAGTFRIYVYSLNLDNLTSLIINGVED